MKWPCFILVTLSLAGCASEASHPPVPRMPIPTDPGHAKYQYRKQAKQLRVMAMRLEGEAARDAEQLGSEANPVKRKLALAQEMRARAEEAERRAEEIVPPDSQP